MAAGEEAMAVAAEETAEGREMIKLKSSDGEEHRMSVKAAMLSQTLSHELEDIGVDQTIPLSNVASIALNLVIRYCEKHAEVALAPAAADNSDPGSGAAASRGKPTPATSQFPAAAAADNSDPGSGAAPSSGKPAPATSKFPAAAGNNSGPRPSSSGTASSGDHVPTTTKDTLETWDKEFVDGLAPQPLYDVLHAANYLSITGLLDLTCAKVADMLNGKTTEQMREILGIVSDYTKEEEDAIREKHAWAFEERDCD